MSDLNEYIAGTQYGPTGGRNYESAWKGDYLSAFLISDVGRRRENNEDSCLLCAPEDAFLARELGLMFSVADGMGGASAGEHASKLALQRLSNHYYTNTVVGGVPTALGAALERANEDVYTEAQERPEFAGMGTTVSAIVVQGDWMYIAQVGDSRVYLLRQGTTLRQITLDHSLVEEQVRSGLITPEEAKNHMLKNLITRAVGIKPSVQVDLFAVQLQRGDTVLLCSDGLSNMVEDARIEAVLRGGSLDECGRTLIREAIENGGKDNITAALVRISDTPPKAAQQEGAEEVTIRRPGFLARLYYTLFNGGG